jgi:hypothetical protein
MAVKRWAQAWPAPNGDPARALTPELGRAQRSEQGPEVSSIPQRIAPSHFGDPASHPVKQRKKNVHSTTCSARGIASLESRGGPSAGAPDLPRSCASATIPCAITNPRQITQLSASSCVPGPQPRTQSPPRPQEPLSRISTNSLVVENGIWKRVGQCCISLKGWTKLITEFIRRRPEVGAARSRCGSMGGWTACWGDPPTGCIEHAKVSGRPGGLLWILCGTFGSTVAVPRRSRRPQGLMAAG